MMLSDAPKFSAWMPILDIVGNRYNCCRHPGIYVISASDQIGAPASGTSFDWPESIIYIGMSIAKEGVSGRLFQFIETIRRCTELTPNKSWHGGAERVLGNFKYEQMDRNSLLDSLIVSVKLYPHENTSESYDYFMNCGSVVREEYVSFASYFEKHGKLPIYNQKTQLKVYTTNWNNKYKKQD